MDAYGRFMEGRFMKAYGRFIRKVYVGEGLRRLTEGLWRLTEGLRRLTGGLWRLTEDLRRLLEGLSLEDRGGWLKPGRRFCGELLQNPCI